MEQMTGAKETEVVVKMTSKNFRLMPEMQEFYRFVHENDLREEVKTLLTMLVGRKTKERRPRARRKLH